MKNIAFDVRLYLPVAAGLLVTMAAFGDGSGSGRLLTPYSGGNASLKQAEDARLREQTNCDIRGVKLQGTQAPGTGYGIGFAYVSQGTISSPPRYSLDGQNDVGQTVSISLADIDDFNVVKVSGARGSESVLFSVHEFPAISVAQLLKLKPSYTKLRESFAAVVSVRVPLSFDGGELSLVGTDYGSSAGKYHVLFPIRSVPAGGAVDVVCGVPGKQGHWWSIQSVITDPNCPHCKAYFKK